MPFTPARLKGDDIINNLLLDEHPLQVMPTLATLIGLNEAIVLQQVHYWLKIKEKANQDYIDGHYWIYNTYEQWKEQFPFWSIMTIRRTITNLENGGLLVARNYNRAGFDKTKWYSINYERLTCLVSSSVQNEQIDCSNCTHGAYQNEQTNTIDYTKTPSKTSFKVLNGATPKRSTIFNWSILEKQIIKSCNKQGVTAYKTYIDIIEYYYQCYMDTFQEEHPRLSTKAMDSIIEAISIGTDMVEDTDFDAYRNMIDKHFQTQYKNCDYNICHFMTEGVRNNRFYETEY